MFEVRHESGNPRGYWLPCEPRQGVTDSDPIRYRRFTLDQLQQRGEADPRYTTDQRDVIADITSDIQEARDTGDYSNSPPFSRHTLLGRKREQKQAAYYQRREDLSGELGAAGLDQAEVDEVLQEWDDLANYRTVQVQGKRGPEFVIYGPDDEVLAGFSAEAIYRAQAEADGELEALEEYIAREKLVEERLDLVAGSGFSLEDLGLSEEDLLGALDEVESLIGDRSVELRIEMGDIEGLDLADFPF